MELNYILTFAALRAANLARLPLFKNAKGEYAHASPMGADWSLPEWGNAMAGETGEACNIAKKLRRGDYGSPDTREYYEATRALAEEIADVVIYADIFAMRAGFRLEDVIADKFNSVSDRIGCDVKI